jgi:hypothetical protein
LPFTGSRIAFETGNPVFDVQGCDFEMQPHCLRWVVNERSHSHQRPRKAGSFAISPSRLGPGRLTRYGPKWP